MALSIQPYCGNCHKFMTETFSREWGMNMWVCDCPVNKCDRSKDPNCHNSGHAHHDPQSPIVLSNKSIRESEEAYDTGVYDKDWHAKTGEYRPPASIEKEE